MNQQQALLVYDLSSFPSWQTTYCTQVIVSNISFVLDYRTSTGSNLATHVAERDNSCRKILEAVKMRLQVVQMQL
jgi:hypothetical protein